MPHHICVNREGLPEGGDPPGFVETEDFVELDGALPPPWGPALQMPVPAVNRGIREACHDQQHMQGSCGVFRACNAEPEN